MNWLQVAADNLVDEARDWWRLWSVRFNAVGLTILAWVTFDPVSVLSLWHMMPSSLRGVVHPAAFQVVALVLFFLGLLARFVRQPKVKPRVPTQ